MTRDTGTVGTSFRHAVDKAKSESKTKRSSESAGHLQDYMDAISHEQSKWGYLEHCHMTHDNDQDIPTYSVHDLLHPYSLGDVPRPQLNVLSLTHSSINLLHARMKFHMCPCL